MVVSQAKAKYQTYPSPGASHWVHRRYLELGGKFEDTEETNRKKQIAQQIIENRRRLQAKKHHDSKHDKDKK
jgi:hypothetical protein